MLCLPNIFMTLKNQKFINIFIHVSHIHKRGNLIHITNSLLQVLNFLIIHTTEC